MTKKKKNAFEYLKRDTRISSSIIPIESIQKLVERQLQDLWNGSYSAEKYLVFAEKAPFEMNIVKPPREQIFGEENHLWLLYYCF